MFLMKPKLFESTPVALPPLDAKVRIAPRRRGYPRNVGAWGTARGSREDFYLLIPHRQVQS